MTSPTCGDCYWGQDRGLPTRMVPDPNAGANGPAPVTLIPVRHIECHHDGPRIFRNHRENITYHEWSQVRADDHHCRNYRPTEDTE